MSFNKHIVPICFIYFNTNQPFSQVLSFKRRPLIWLPVKPIDYITALGFASLWHVENLAWCSANKGGSLCLMKHDSITQQGKHVCYQRQSAYAAFGKSPLVQLGLNI